MMNSSKLDALIAVALLVAVSLGCAGMKRPWRDYSELKFDSKAWLAGDAIERGRMTRDIVMNRVPEGYDADTVKKEFGEPDLQKTIEGKKVWLYRIDLGMTGGMDLFPISFDGRGRAMAGVVRGSTFSMYMKSDEV